MQTIAHPMPHPGRTQRRVVGLSLAILLQAGLVWALVNGLDIRKVFVDPPRGPFEVTIPKKDVHPPPPPPEGTVVEPKPVETIQPPVFETDERGEGGITLNPGRGPAAGPADHGPVSVMNTHTTPPYPALERRLGVEGTVVLRLTISAQGLVTDAAVVRTSGSDGLDRAAQAWVVRHWRYQPAVRGGSAVPATANVAVEFKLRREG